MFQFTGLAATRLWIQRALIRVSQDQHSFVNSPGLFADFHALHRLLTPRHPPYALSSLTTIIQDSRPGENSPVPSFDPHGSRPIQKAFLVFTLPTTIFSEFQFEIANDQRLPSRALSNDASNHASANRLRKDSPPRPSSLHRRCLLPLLQPNCQRTLRRSFSAGVRPNGQKPHPSGSH